MHTGSAIRRTNTTRACWARAGRFPVRAGEFLTLPSPACLGGSEAIEIEKKDERGGWREVCRIRTTSKPDRWDGTEAVEIVNSEEDVPAERRGRLLSATTATTLYGDTCRIYNNQ